MNYNNYLKYFLNRKGTLIFHQYANPRTLALKTHYTSLSYQPFVFFDAIKRNKRKQYGGFLHILLILRIISVVLILTYLQSSGAAKHNIYNADPAQQGNDPLKRTTESRHSGKQNTGPDDNLPDDNRKPCKGRQAPPYKGLNCGETSQALPDPVRQWKIHIQ